MDVVGKRCEAVETRVAGDVLLRPVPLVALTVLVVNDHILKPSWPNWLTGKLSDIAGLVLLPLLLVAVVDIVFTVAPCPTRMPRGATTAIVFTTAGTFALVKASPSAARLYGDALGWLRYPLTHVFNPVIVTHDLTDLAALPACLIAWAQANAAVRGASAADRPNHRRRPGCHLSPDR